jgi:hypothetical protein
MIAPSPCPFTTHSMCQPIELIFAKADSRIRHQREIVDTKSQIDAFRLQKTIDFRKHLEDRAGINQRIAERESCQTDWLKLVQVLMYVSSVGSVVRAKVELIKKVRAAAVYFHPNPTRKLLFPVLLLLLL